MKFALLARQDSTGRIMSWETYDEETPCAKKWSRDIIDWFNRTLNPGQSSRTLFAVAVLGKGTRKHNWRKTNNVTILKRGDCYDTYECQSCRVTGKRHGLQEYVRIDRKYKAKKYQDCEWYYKVKR